MFETGNKKRFNIKPFVISIGLILFGLFLYRGTVQNMEVSWVMITAEELEKRLPPEGYTLMDVRQPEEYQQGHIPGAVSVPLSELEKELKKFNPDQEIVLYCKSGNRSARAAGILSNYGFTNIINYTEGMIGWKGEIDK